MEHWKTFHRLVFSKMFGPETGALANVRGNNATYSDERIKPAGQLMQSSRRNTGGDEETKPQSKKSRG